MRARALVVIVVAVSASRAVSASPCAHHGFTAEAQAGGSKTTFEGSNLETHNGYALRAGLGWFLGCDVALSVRAARDGGTGGFHSTLLGLGVQYWWSERTWFGLAAGRHVTSFADTPDDSGVGVEFRVGYTLPSIWSERHMWNVSLETQLIDPISHDRGALAAALLLGYQFR